VQNRFGEIIRAEIQVLMLRRLVENEVSPKPVTDNAAVDNGKVETGSHSKDNPLSISRQLAISPGALKAIETPAVEKLPRERQPY
jgi:hypothetical protein